MEELMKKILLVVVLVVMCMSIFAQVQITPYGSARVGFWYTVTDEDYALDPERTQMDFNLQSNSRFGVNFQNDALTANVELGANGTIRFLWGRQKFNNWSLLVGLTEDGTNQGARQVFGGDNMLRGWGAVYNGRNPMVRFEMDNGLYLAMIRPYTGSDPAGNPDAIDALIPRINLGWNLAHKTVRLQPTFVLQMYDYNEDRGQEGSVMAWLGALTFDYNENKFGTKVHVNYGVNIGQMGYGAFMQGHPVNAGWDPIENETVDITTLGAVFTAGWDFTPNFNMNFGVGYVSSDMDDWEETDDRMAFYLQAVFKAKNLRIIPEVGMLDYMDNQAGDSRGTVMYFGTQLRLDF